MAARWSEMQKLILTAGAGNHSPQQLADMCGKSVSAVQNYARKHDISLGIKRKPFTPDEDAALHEHIAAGRPAPAIANLMGRSVKSIRGRVEYLRQKQADYDEEN